MAIDCTIPVLVGILQAHMLQDRRFMNIEPQRKQLPPMPGYSETLWLRCVVSDQRSAAASDHHHNAHQVEWENPGCRQPVRVEMYIERHAATVPVARIEAAHTPATNHDRPHVASCHPTPSEVYLG
jgi:hypothetical protein